MAEGRQCGSPRAVQSSKVCKLTLGNKDQRRSPTHAAMLCDDLATFISQRCQACQGCPCVPLPSSAPIWVAVVRLPQSTVYHAAICDVDKRGVRITKWRLAWRKGEEGKTTTGGRMMRYTKGLTVNSSSNW